MNYSSCNSEIDIVVTWVDPSDPDWNALRVSHSKSEKYEEVADFSVARHRDWDNLRYWFRGVEKFAPWVRKVHFITHGHLPVWLNVNHPKLNIVKHADYIDSKYLPTFNSRVIELNLPFISDLSEKFVLFNDDFFLIESVDPGDFFQHGFPCDAAILNAYSGGGLSPIQMNDLYLINNVYNKKRSISSNFFKWFNYRYRWDLLRTMALLSWPNFTGFKDFHLPQPYLKSNLVKCWGLYTDPIKRTCFSKFRLKSDINHYLFRYNHLAKGEFRPFNCHRLGRYFQVNDEIAHYVAEHIINQKSSIVAINDGELNDFDSIKNIVNRALDHVLPDKSRYEL
jgi:hypothetical protein